MGSASSRNARHNVVDKLHEAAVTALQHIDANQIAVAEQSEPVDDPNALDDVLNSMYDHCTKFEPIDRDLIQFELCIFALIPTASTILVDVLRQYAGAPTISEEIRYQIVLIAGILLLRTRDPSIVAALKTIHDAIPFLIAYTQFDRLFAMCYTTSPKSASSDSSHSPPIISPSISRSNSESTVTSLKAFIPPYKSQTRAIAFNRCSAGTIEADRDLAQRPLVVIAVDVHDTSDSAGPTPMNSSIRSTLKANSRSKSNLTGSPRNSDQERSEESSQCAESLQKTMRRRPSLSPPLVDTSHDLRLSRLGRSQSEERAY